MLEYKEAIDNYYKLKDKYDKQIKKVVSSISNNINLSVREKRKEFLEYKPKCINCLRPVGTIFSSKFNEDEGCRTLIAMCGDRVNPCYLNINISAGYVALLPELIKENEDMINENKYDIIKYKNSLLFGYLSS